MARRSTAPPRLPAGLPATTAEAAAFVRDFVVKLYDRQDGKGVDWKQIAGTLFRASFDALAEMPPDKKMAFAERAHARLYEVMTDDPAPSNSLGDGAENAPSNTAGLKSPRPKPPHGLV